MGRCKKRDLLNMIATMMEANDSIRSNIFSKQQSTSDIFIQCQEAALQIGTILEAMGDHYTAIISLLEDYWKIFIR